MSKEHRGQTEYTCVEVKEQGSPTTGVDDTAATTTTSSPIQTQARADTTLSG